MIPKFVSYRGANQPNTRNQAFHQILTMDKFGKRCVPAHFGRRSYHNLNQGNGAPPENQDETTGGGIADSVIERRRRAEIVIIKSAQHEVFAKEIDQIKNGEKLSKGSALVKLNPVICPNLLCGLF